MSRKQFLISNLIFFLVLVVGAAVTRSFGLHTGVEYISGGIVAIIACMFNDIYLRS